MRTLVIDVGGTNIKVRATGQEDVSKIASGASMTADGMVRAVLAVAQTWDYFEDYVGLRGLERLGKKKWRRAVADVVVRLKAAMVADYVVLGGGNAKQLRSLPVDARLGDNRNAFLGGLRLWDDQVSVASPSHPSFSAADAE